MTTQGEIPQSNALAEAQVDSISELFSRDPEMLKPGSPDLTRIIVALREQRVKWATLEAEGKTRGQKAKTATPKTLLAGTNAEELDL